MRLELHKRLPDGSTVFVQPLTPIAESEREAWLNATYGKRAGLFIIREHAPLSASMQRALDQEARLFMREGTRAPVPSAASAIMARLDLVKGRGA